MVNPLTAADCDTVKYKNETLKRKCLAVIKHINAIAKLKHAVPDGKYNISDWNTKSTTTINKVMMHCNRLTDKSTQKMEYFLYNDCDKLSLMHTIMTPKMASV